MRSNGLKKYMSRVAELGCILCHHLGNIGEQAHLHHLREEQGAAQRGSDWTTIPLCPEHHIGSSGIHGLGRKEFERRYKLTELDLLAMTIERLNESR